MVGNRQSSPVKCSRLSTKPRLWRSARPNRHLMLKQNWIATSVKVRWRPRLPRGAASHCMSRSSQMVNGPRALRASGPVGRLAFGLRAQGFTHVPSLPTAKRGFMQQSPLPGSPLRVKPLGIGQPQALFVCCAIGIAAFGIGQHREAPLKNPRNPHEHWFSCGFCGCRTPRLISNRS